MKAVLSIAGSDSIGGAGIQADIKAMSANGVYVMTAITALTAQNTLGVSAIMEASGEFLKQQIDAIFSDIRPDSVKIGMVASTTLIEAIAERLRFYEAKNIVLDPVMVATSGAKLIEDSAINALKTNLFPLSTLITPNIPEAEILANMEIKSSEDMLKAGSVIFGEFGTPVLIKGGHSLDNADDLLYSAEIAWFRGQKIDGINAHGTGCTLSSAIAANLAKGYDLRESVKRAKDYITLALQNPLNLGNGTKPINHIFSIGNLS